MSLERAYVDKTLKRKREEKDRNAFFFLKVGESGRIYKNKQWSAPGKELQIGLTLHTSVLYNFC